MAPCQTPLIQRYLSVTWLDNPLPSTVFRARSIWQPSSSFWVQWGQRTSAAPVARCAPLHFTNFFMKVPLATDVAPPDSRVRTPVPQKAVRRAQPGGMGIWETVHFFLKKLSYHMVILVHLRQFCLYRGSTPCTY